ncbi:hypothetical protein Pdw03_2998 [Penicillium digitatum]|uniref:Uncharacterized protein n=1 Tax=Penicillium digitatum TaxID=36651 RepID=A0A7T7BHN8_PENDI|nr:hypothetical protein Pdw03_2998 [Penicillium digitatum]
MVLATTTTHQFKSRRPVLEIKTGLHPPMLRLQPCQPRTRLSPEGNRILALIHEWLPSAEFETDKSGNRLYTDAKRDLYVAPLLSLLNLKGTSATSFSVALYQHPSRIPLARAI